MAYEDMSHSRSYQQFDSHGPFEYAAQPFHQPYVEYSTTQDFVELYYSSPTDSDSSTLSSEDEDEDEDEDELGIRDEEILACATEFTKHEKQPAFIPSALSKPVVIPQVVAGTGKAFARCWCPALAPYNITETGFLEFIDNLNIVAAASPPLRVLDLVGGVLGMVPHHIFMLAGLGVQALAKLGTVIVSKSRTETYMKTVNKELFAPRGLNATITSRDAMATLLKLPDSIARLAPITDETMDYSMLERRLQPIKPYMSELRFDVPPPVEQTDILAKMSAAQIKRQIASAEKKAMRHRRKQLRKIERENSKLSRDQNKEQRKSQRKSGKKIRKLDKDARKAEKKAEKRSRKGGRSAEKAELNLGENLAKIEQARIEEQRKQAEREFRHNARDGIDSTPQLAWKDKENRQAKRALWIVITHV